MRRLLLALLLLTPSAFAAPPTVLHAHLDPTIGAIYSGSPDAEDLSGWLWVAPGDVFGEPSPSDWALVRVVASSPEALYVWPYPVEDGRHTLRIVESPLLFADGFEHGDLWTWSFARGSDLSLLAGGEVAARLAMANSVQWYNVLSFSGLDSGGSSVSVILSERIGGSSGAADTPASERFRYVMRSFNSVSWKAIRQQSGWPDIGGVVDHADYHVIADNTRNPSTNVGPLDDLQDLEFEGQSATMYSVRTTWDSTLNRWYPQSLASSQILWKGTILNSSFSGVSNSEFSLSIREQTRYGLLTKKSSPVQYLGLGGGVEIENGGTPSSGARIVRLDASSLRGTGDQWFATGLLYYNIGFSGTEITLIDSPIFRLRGDPSGTPNVLKAQLRNAAGTWVTVGASISISHQEFKGILVNYDSSGTPSAEAWVNGTSIGSTTITGGIYAASSASTTFYNTPTSGTTPFQHFFFRHGTRLLADSEIPDRSQYSFDFSEEANLDCALEFNERTGDKVQDMAGVQGAVLTGFADANGAWVSSGTGEPSSAKSYPRVFLGVPFMAQVDLVDVAFQIYAAGYGSSSSVNFRAVVADGARLAPTVSTTASSVDFNATTQQIAVTDSEFNTDPAIGQTLTFSAGGNLGDHVVAQLLWDPRLLPGGSVRRWAATGSSVVADETATIGNWSSATGAWSDYFAALIPGLSAFETSGATEHMAALVKTGGATAALAEAYLENLGPVAGTVTTSNLASVTGGGGGFGWQGDGSADAWVHADLLARVTPSAEYSPSVVYRNSSGTYLVTGSDLSPAAATYSWGEARIKSATKAAFPGEYDGVRVLFAPAFNPVPPGKVTATLAVDQLAREATIEWREVTAAGGGSNELILETYFLVRAHAQAFADAVFSMLSGKLYSVQLFGPILPAEAAMAPFTAVTVDWSADSYLDGGANGIVVGLEVNQDKSATALVFFGS